MGIVVVLEAGVELVKKAASDWVDRPAMRIIHTQ
jgi:hypothetical protein